MTKREADAAARTPTTGHEWDGIEELNTPLPRWWLWTFYATIVWAIVYWIFYPAWPTVTGYTRGVLGYTNRAQVSADLADLQKVRGAKGAALTQVSLADIEKDPALLAFAQAQGKAAFGNNCAPCHGVGATGAKGYPNLNDDDWLWGGTLDEIKQTIEHGVRSGDAKDHESAMPAFGKMGMLKPDEIVTVANYVRSLSGPSGASRHRSRGGQEDLRRQLRRLPRRRRQGQPGARRAEPHRQDLALRIRRSRHRRHHHQQPWRRDAGLGRPARSRDDQCAHGLRAHARRGQMRHHSCG